MPQDFEGQLRDATEAILQSGSSKRLVVAGPGAGKTTTFRLLLEREPTPQDQRLVLTFINNLKAELEEKLGQLSQVMTFHGYCYRLLRQRPGLQGTLSEGFKYYPPLPSLIKTDWQLLRDQRAPRFVDLMRKAEAGEETDFYIERANYYDAVSFDDSVFRVYTQLKNDPAQIEQYDVIIVDEYQDFNRLEAMFIDLLATRNRIVIAGDDDQALYSQLRGSSPKFIRDLHRSHEYETFELPFCQRCTEVVISAVHDIVQQAARTGRLAGRISKTFLHYPPRKAADSQKYPKIKVIETSVQSNKVNFFGRYISQEISRIPHEEIVESRQEGFPTVLVIGPIQYRRQIQGYLERDGYTFEVREGYDSATVERHHGLRILKEDPQSNLAWRIVLEVDQPSFIGDAVRVTGSQQATLIEQLPQDYRNRVLEEVLAWQDEGEGAPEQIPITQLDAEHPTVKLTSFEGSKGLSAQRVFIVGLQESDLPRDPININDLEICKLIVALTRTRKECHLIYTKRWGTGWKRPSVFLSWISPQRIEVIKINKAYWESHS